MDDHIIKVYRNQLLNEVNSAFLEFGNMQASNRPGNNNEVFMHLHHFLIHTAMIFKIIQPKYTSGNGSFLETRETALRAKYTELPTIDTTSLQIRNDLEHLDDRIDNWAQNSRSHSIATNNIGSYDFLEDFDDIDKFLFLNPQSLKAYFWGNEYDLRKLLEYVHNVMQALTQNE